jgi:hypothetical protein
MSFLLVSWELNAQVYDLYVAGVVVVQANVFFSFFYCTCGGTGAILYSYIIIEMVRTINLSSSTIYPYLITRDYLGSTKLTCVGHFEGFHRKYCFPCCKNFTVYILTENRSSTSFVSISYFSQFTQKYTPKWHEQCYVTLSYLHLAIRLEGKTTLCKNFDSD